MSSSTSSSERRFVTGLFVLILGAEIGFAALAHENQGRHEVDDCVHSVETAPAPIAAVFLSDSVSYGVLDNVELPTGVLDLSSNQAIGAAGNHFLVKRLFERLKREGSATPGFIVYALNPVSFDSDLDSERFLEPYFTSVFCRPEEIDDVAASLAPPRVARITKKMRRGAFERSVQLPSYVRRGLLHLPLRDGLRATKRWLQSSTGNVNEAPGGAHLWESAAKARIEERSHEDFVVSEVSEIYLPKLAELCAAEGATLLILAAPVPPTLRNAWKESGFQSALEIWLGDFAGSHPAVRFSANSPFQPQSDDVFYDGVHLTQSAKNEWAEVLLGLLSDPASFLAAQR